MAILIKTQSCTIGSGSDNIRIYVGIYGFNKLKRIKTAIPYAIFGK